MHLVHVTSKQNASRVLRDGHLVAGASQGQGSKPGSTIKVYMQFILATNSLLNDYASVDTWDENVFLVFDHDKLLRERSDLHMTIGWQYGAFVMEDSYVKKDFDSFLRRIRRAKSKDNEVVFDRSVPCDKYLTAIWVGPDVSAKFIAEFRDHVGRSVPVIRTTHVPAEVIDLT